MTTTGIPAKMRAVMDAVRNIPKTGVNPHFGYKYATDQDVFNAVRAAMVEHGLTLTLSIVEVTRTPVGNKMHTCAKFEYTIYGDADEHITGTWFAEAIGNDDKAINKCATAALKQLLLKLFIIPTGDDPDHDKGTPDDDDADAGADAENAWVTDKESINGFKHWLETRGLTWREGLAALSVKSIKEFPGSKADAVDLVNAYIEAKTSREIASGKKA